MEPATVTSRRTTWRGGRAAAGSQDRRPWRVAAVVAVLGLVVAACGGGTSTSSSTTSTTAGGAAPVLSAYNTTVAAQTCHLALRLGVTQPGQAPVDVTGAGAASFTGNQAELTLTVPQAGTFQVRLVGGTVYLMFPPQLQAATGGKPWASVSEASLDPGSASGTGLGTTGSDPNQILGYLQGVSSSVTNLGPATIRGAQTTHYRAIVDLNKAASLAGARGAAYQRFASEIRNATIPVDVWIDSKGRVNQLQIQTAVTTARAGTGNLNLVVQFYDFGVPVSVVPPSAGQVGALSIPTTTAP